MQVPAFGAISHTPNPPLNGLHENESSLGHGQRSSMTADTNTLDAPSLSKQLKTSPQNVEVQAQSSNDPSPTFARIPKRKHAGDEQRIFCCTFCRQNFKTKYDWSRHEKSLHLDLEAWTCAPESGIMNDPFTGHDVCAYCIHPQPTTEHVEAHNHSACLGMARTFSRKDHLVQHLRLVHRLTEIPPLDGWRVQAPPIVCRCGFCGEQLTGWGKRTDHLAGHFRKGATMHGWQGEHGFAAEIAAQVRNSIPPYLIADHALSSMDCGE